jgi:cytochrome oxidase Cu insertion factor (SCO1/SenC/PrrC family)
MITAPMKDRRTHLSLFRASAPLLLLMAAQALAAEIPQYDRVRTLESPVRIEDAALTDYQGEAFKLSALRGRVAFVFFGFTHCSDVCPVTLEQFRKFRASDGVDVERTAFVMISVDGERDTPPVMKAYLAQFSNDFIGLTAPPAEVKKLARQFSAAFFKRRTATPDEYTMSHSPQVFVVDPAGQLRAELYAASIDAMGGIAATLLNESR